MEEKNFKRYDSRKFKNKKIDGQYLYEIIDEINYAIKEFRQREHKIKEKYFLYPFEITRKILFPIF